MRRRREFRIVSRCRCLISNSLGVMPRSVVDRIAPLIGARGGEISMHTGEGPSIISRAGLVQIRRKSMRQTELIADRARTHGFRIMPPADPELRGGTVSLAVPHASRVSRELLRRNIIVDYRDGSGIRIAPLFYTADDEVEEMVEEIREILDAKAYRRHRPVRSTVT